VLDEVLELFRGEPEIDRHEHGANLRHRVERGELLMRVRRDVSHTVARLYIHHLWTYCFHNPRRLLSKRKR
jgi:hypothetical protein